MSLNTEPPELRAEGWALTVPLLVSITISLFENALIEPVTEPPVAAAPVNLSVPKSASDASVHEEEQISGDSAIHSAEESAAPLNVLWVV